MPPKNKATQTLNSKTPNPYEVAYKELWDQLPAWKRNAIVEDKAAGRSDSRIHDEFIKAVNLRAEELYETANN